ncbi:ROK family transcriptional regulator [Amycolatopsis sp. NPDC023774]|uniref:ROK family transcriptional regulator n=1 Tax=Amycolatopsis sp. NPDC023774 TaxID=3155015 RepID=UPI0033CBFFD7
MSEPNPVRAHNTAVVLGLLRAHRTMSRTELARRSGLSLPTVMAIVEQLLADGFVRAAGSGPATGGRPSRLYEFDPSGRFAIGVSLGTHTASAVLTDLDATVVDEASEPSELLDGPDATVAQTRRLIDLVLPAPRRDRVQGIGLGVAALVLDSEDRALRPHADWPAVPLRSLIAQHYGLAAEIENYAKAVSVGEHRFGAGRGRRNMLCVVLQDGVGAGLISDGELYRGDDGAAGRFGATLVHLPGRPRVPLDEVAGAAGIEALANARTPGRRWRVAEVFTAAEAGDPTARAVVGEVGAALAEAIHNAVVLAAPDLVVLSGNVASAGGALLADPVRDLLTNALTRGRTPSVVPGALSEQAGAIGAAALLLQNTFVDPRLP